MGTGRLDIELLPILEDNYAYLIFEPGAARCAVVDPGAAQPVLARLRQLGRELHLILITHHHADHTAGLGQLKRETGAEVVLSRGDVARVNGIEVPPDRTVAEGEEFQLGAVRCRVLETPGHTRSHVSYWFPEAEAVFCGDTLFALGCGRLFEGTPEQMWQSLLKLRALPETTRMYCGHEYTLANARFALAVDPDNAELRARAREVEELRRQGRPTLPSTIGLERRTNPFLRADDPGLKRALGLEGEADAAVFAELRRRKDRF